MENFIWIKAIFYLCILLRQNEATEFMTSGELQICPGEQQTLVCSANYTFLEWSITTISLPLLHRTIVPYEDQTLSLTPITINSAKFTFSRDSSPRTLPLVSTMTIENATSNLEGTVVNCTGINSSLSTVVLMKSIIHVFDVNTDFPHPPEIVIRTDMILFGNDNFTATLEWSQISGETYTVATTPEPEHTNFTKSTTVQMVMLYNIQYNVNVTATDTLCGHRNTANLKIHYANCSIPPAKNGVVLMFNSTSEGSQLMFWCDKLSNDPMIASCLSDGRWSIDIGDYSCATSSFKPANISREVITNLIIAMISSNILLTTIFFILGCILGRFWHKHKKSTEKSDDAKGTHCQIDSEHTSSATGHNVTPAEQDLEMAENVAYGPLKFTTTT